MQSYWLVGAGFLITVLLAIGVVAGLLVNEQDLEEDIPEYAVQQFLKAVSKQDYEEIHSLLSNKFENCSVEDLVSEGVEISRMVRDQRVTLEHTQYVEGVAIVRVRITEFSSDGPFGSSENSQEQAYSLRKEWGLWKFTKLPWPYYSCGYSSPMTLPVLPSTPIPERPQGHGR
ncbi:MAG: hypothetical protein QGF12_04405 [SAR202 cluster bacterium]|nr:hypothetical protein [SAR202 cluster bacterium]